MRAEKIKEFNTWVPLKKSLKKCSGMGEHDEADNKQANWPVREASRSGVSGRGSEMREHIEQVCNELKFRLAIL